MGSLKNPIFRGREGGCLQKTNIEGGDYLKKGGGGPWQEREGDVY